MMQLKTNMARVTDHQPAYSVVLIWCTCVCGGGGGYFISLHVTCTRNYFINDLCLCWVVMTSELCILFMFCIMDGILSDRICVSNFEYK